MSNDSSEEEELDLPMIKQVLRIKGREFTIISFGKDRSAPRISTTYGLPADGILVSSHGVHDLDGIERYLSCPPHG